MKTYRSLKLFTGLMVVLTLLYMSTAQAQSTSRVFCTDDYTARNLQIPNPLYMVVNSDDYSQGWVYTEECATRRLDDNGESLGLLFTSGDPINDSTNDFLNGSMKLNSVTVSDKQGRSSTVSLVRNTWTLIDLPGIIRFNDVEVELNVASQNAPNTVNRTFDIGFLVKGVRVTYGLDPRETGIVPTQDFCADVGGGKFWNAYTMSSRCDDQLIQDPPGAPEPSVPPVSDEFPFGFNADAGFPFCAPTDDRWGNLSEYPQWTGPRTTCYQAGQSSGSGSGPSNEGVPPNCDVATTTVTSPITWPAQSGWVQIQSAETYETICQGVSSCDVSPGNYTFLNFGENPVLKCSVTVSG